MKNEDMSLLALRRGREELETFPGALEVLWFPDDEALYLLVLCEGPAERAIFRCDNGEGELICRVTKERWTPPFALQGFPEGEPILILTREEMVVPRRDSQPEQLTATVMKRRIHALKTHPGPYRALLEGRKRFEFRRDDRAYEEGDLLALYYWDPSTGGDSLPIGRKRDRTWTLALVTWVLRGGFGLPEGYVCMSLKPLEHTPEAQAALERKFQEDARYYSTGASLEFLAIDFRLIGSLRTE